MSPLSLALALQVAATPLTLDEVRDASKQQLDAIRSQIAYERAGTQQDTARAAILPQVNLTFGLGAVFVGPQRQFLSFPDPNTGDLVQTVRDVNNSFLRGNFNLGLQVQQLLYDGGRWWTQLALTGAQTEAAEGQLKEQQLASELEATRRFYSLVKAQLALKVLNETVSRSREQLERAKALYEAGRGTRGAVYDATTNLGNDEINVVRQKQSIVAARLSLLQWIGRTDADVEAVPPTELTQPGPAIAVDESVEQGRKQRPLFKSLQATVRASELAITSARADYFPSLSVSAGYTRNSPSADPFFTDFSRQHQLSAGVNMSWNLFSGLSHLANEDRAKLDLRRAQAEQKQSLIDLETEIRTAVQSEATEREVLSIAERNLGQAEEQAKLEEERFAAGSGSSLEVRNAQIKYTQAQLSVLQGRADVATARAALSRAVGGTQ